MPLRTENPHSLDNDETCPLIWPRAIIHMDMNAFFASVEQRDFPELRGQPVAVTNGEIGTCIITSSYEARAHGIRTGMRLKQARQLCPNLIQRPARPEVYARVSTTIMQALQDISPDMEVFSVDEAFLDVAPCQRLHGSPPRMGRMTKQRVLEVSGLICSVGVAGDKTTAKFAAKLQKPDGLTVIPPWEARRRLQHEPATSLCGIAEGIGSFLAQHGAHTCGEVGQLPVSVLARRFGNIGRRIWLMCQGADPDKVHLEIPAAKSIGHGKVVPPDTRDKQVLLTYLLHMSEKVAARLRRHQLEALHYFIGLRSRDGWVGNKLRLAMAGNDSKPLFQLCRFVLDNLWHGEGIHQVQITALDPRPCHRQIELFDGFDEEHARLNRIMDDINRRYGEFTLAPARLLKRSSMPNVIAPAWKPSGHRQTI
ncbi:MAG: DNA polymerase IV [Gammaproteobacteria bacterium]|nr:MAG: DNA polymerase IV [Gammaproteobacteria bacterium]